MRLRPRPISNRVSFGEIKSSFAELILIAFKNNTKDRNKHTEEFDLSHVFDR